MSMYLEGFKGFYETLSTYVEKYANLPRKNKNHANMIKFAGEYYEAYQKELSDQPENEFLTNASELFLQIQESVETQNLDMLNQLLGETKKIMHQEEAKMEWMQTVNDIFQKDFEQMRLRGEMKETLQSLVDGDMKIYGEVTQKTKEVLEVHHFELINGQVYEDNGINNKEMESLNPTANQITDLDEFISQHREKLGQIKKETGKKTLIVNAYAGPGAGKTTACLETVAELKKMGYIAEYVPEYAKELVYDNPALLDGSREHQLHILAEQVKRLDRFMGKADIIVTDASILLNPVYLAEPDPDYENAISKLYGQYDNFNFYVHRGTEYVQEGRMENLEESLEKDQQIRDILDKHSLFYGNFSHRTVDKLAEKIEVTYKKILEADKARNPEAQHKESYQGTAYHGKENKFKIIYGNSPEELISRLQGWNQSRTEEMKFHNVYIRKLNSETNQYENASRYNVDTGKDITPIYLVLPYLDDDAFKLLTEQLKKDGAKFNGTKKAWYVTKEDDLNKFADYLPIAITRSSKSPHREEKSAKGNRESVKGKLEANKRKIEPITQSPDKTVNEQQR